MPKIPSGSSIRRFGARNELGVAGCLVQFPCDPEKLFWLTAGHVVVSSEAEQFDPIEATDLPGQTIGRLYGWTNLDGEFTVDAALVWVDPDLVLPEIQGFGTPSDINLAPEMDARLRIFVKGQVHVGTIEDLAGDLEVRMIGPDFNQNFTFRNQIICNGFNAANCSGAIAVDDNGLVVGIVVAGGEKTAITPIGEILGHPDWGLGDPLELVTEVPRTAVPPIVPLPRPAPVPVPSGTLEDALRAAVRFNEIGNKSPYQISFAVKGRSGCSFGFMQGDMAAGQPIVRSTFRNALAAAGVHTTQIEDLVRRLSVPRINPLSAGEIQLINNALNAPRGRELVDAMDTTIFANVRQDLDLCVAKAAAAGRRIAPEAQIPMLLWINMSGRPTTLLDWVSGNNVVLSGRLVRAPDTTIDGQEMEEYLRATKFFTENPQNLDHFRTAVQEGIKILGSRTTPGPVATMPGPMAMGRVDQSGLRRTGTIRDKPIAPELEDLLERAAATVGIDKVFVTSGGQPGFGGQRTGSTRHDGGRAADLQLIVGGRTLTFTDRDGNSTIEAFITEATALGAIGIGAGEGYMGNRTIHVGFGETPQDRRRITWGAGGKPVNAPRWLQQAAQQGWNSPVPPPLFAMGEHEEEDQPA